MGKIYDIGPRSTFVALPTGEYTLTLKSWEEQIEEGDVVYNGKTITHKGDIKIEFTWDVDVPGGESQERRVRVAIPSSWSSRATMVHIANALRVVDDDRAASDGASLNFDLWLRKQCLGTIVRKPKESDPKVLTDSITAYAPLPQNAQNASVGAPERTAGTGLVQRYQRLINFAGTQDTVPEGLSSLEIAGRMKLLGAGDMTDRAQRTLKDAIDLLQMASDGPYPEIGTPVTLKDGLLALDKLETALSALD